MPILLIHFRKNFQYFQWRWVYIIEDIPMSAEENQRWEFIKQEFSFSQVIQIIKHESNMQHAYSFELVCTQKHLAFFLANYTPMLKRFISVYERQCKDAIEFVSADKSYLELLYSCGEPQALSNLLETCLETRDSLEEGMYVPHALTQTLVKLSPQRARCFQLLLRGLSAKEIAQQMNLSYRTIQNYVGFIYEQLGVSNNRELIYHFVYLIG